MSQLVSVASGYGATQYDTKIPSLGDAANIVEAFKLYHYGKDDYDGTSSPASDSIEQHFIDLKSLVDQKLSISSASSNYSTITYTNSSLNSASNSIMSILTSSSASLYAVTNSASTNLSRLVDRKTTSGSTYTLVLDDAGKLIEHSHSASVTFVIPPNFDVAFPISTRVDVLQAGAGQLKFTAGSGVTVNFFENKTWSKGQWATVTLIKRGTDTWLAIGNLWDS